MNKAVKFDPVAKTNAHDLYNIFIKYGPRSENKSASYQKQIKSITARLADIYLSVYLDDQSDLVKSIKELIKQVRTLESETNLFKEITEYFVTHTESSPLKTLNRGVLDILEIGHLSDDYISLIIEKMATKKRSNKKKTVTTVALDPDAKTNYIRESKGLPMKLIEVDKRRLNLWVTEVVEKGIEAVQQDESWGDHQLVRDSHLKDKRSVRLSYAGRVIYTIDQEVREDHILYKVLIVKITSAHDYTG